MRNRILQLVKSFEQNPNVFIKNQDAFIEKISKLVEDGKTKLQVIADFDWTLTKCNVNGDTTMHCFDIFSLLPALNDSYQVKTDEFLHKYVKLLSEADNDEEKHLISKRWFDDHEQLVLGVKITADDLTEAVVRANAPLRDGCAAYIEALASSNIPLTVVSSGIGDIIQVHLQEQGIQCHNIVSNFLHLENDVVRGFKEPFVSTYNKDSLCLPGTDDRPNIILLGDSLEDHKMCDSVTNKQTVLKIGYCQDLTKVVKYLEYFDILLIDDQTMDAVKDITSLVVKPIFCV